MGDLMIIIYGSKFIFFIKIQDREGFKAIFQNFIIEDNFETIYIVISIFETFIFRRDRSKFCSKSNIFPFHVYI